MKRIHLIILIMSSLMLSCSDLLAADPDLRDRLLPGDRRYYSWGEDVVYAAIYPYGWQERNHEDFEGKMFPFYFGYISFDDQGDQKMLYFTSGNNTNTQYVESMCERINLGRGMATGEWFMEIDDPQFGVALYGALRIMEIREITRLPLGTAKDYDFSFKEQMRFTYEEGDGMPGRYTRTMDMEMSVSKENLIMTPKQ